MFQKISFLLFGLLFILFLQSCENLPKTTKSGLKYIIHKHNDKGRKGKEGELMLVNFSIKTSTDSTLASTYQMHQTQPFPVPSDTLKNGRIESEGISMLVEGDSATFYVVADTFFKQNRQEVPKFITPGTDLRITLKIEKVQTMQEMQAEMQKKFDVQKVSDQKLIDQYIAKNNIPNIQKTASGLNYVITQSGSGDKPSRQMLTSVKYTGKLLNGTVFDSSDKQDKPFEFPVGVGAVIPGWDEGILLLNKGSKATLLVPSHLGYGPNGAGKVIPPNSVLVFDVELVDFKKQAH